MGEAQPGTSSADWTCEAAGIQVRLFARLREEAGWQQRWLSCSADPPSPITPATIWPLLGLQEPLSHLRVAINQQFASADTPLHPGDELAFLPPISGG